MPLRTVELDVLSADRVADNPADRCYFCKKAIFSALIAAARSDGYTEIADGTNASDRVDDRPGMRALREIGARPLRECGLTKAEVRALVREGGALYRGQALLRLPRHPRTDGERITLEKLQKVERPKSALFAWATPICESVCAARGRFCSCRKRSWRAPETAGGRSSPH